MDMTACTLHGVIDKTLEDIRDDIALQRDRMSQCVTTKTFAIFMGSMTALFVAMFGFSLQMSASSARDVGIRALEQAAEIQRLALAQQDVRLDIQKLQMAAMKIGEDTTEIKTELKLHVKDN